MKLYNSTLLIPVSRNLCTSQAVAEAMRRANPGQTTIHLVCLMHTLNPLILFHPSCAFQRTLNEDLDSYLKALFNLMHWKELIEKNCHGIRVRVHLKKAFSWQSLLKQTIQRVGIGTIIVAGGPKEYWLSFGKFISLRRLALKTGCKILTVKADLTLGLSAKTETLATVVNEKLNTDTSKGISAFYSHSFSQSLSPN